MAKKYWLLKTEPATYSFTTLQKEKRTTWNGVRNFQARNFLKEFQVGDLALIYHSGKEKAVMGVAEIARAGYPEVDNTMPGEWIQVDLTPKRALAIPVTLAQLKAEKTLAKLLLLKQSRLSVMPVTHAEFKQILKIGG
ncbi:MAG: hypothetical protein A2X86_20235 [Bdellovibrionales bacterium GWA2_49_15]|nr:MAG: hypothetical protein A2X86_20235 [Bdellovibrionales bacterium GWA2_49_15]HAZ11358.1 EVE domain-containing protein [Bdellovibrionales bacterium]